MRSGTPAALLGALVWSLAADATAAGLATKTDAVEVEVRSEPEMPVRDRKTVVSTREGDMKSKIGSFAVAFVLEDTAGTVHRLEQYRGHWLLMVFLRHLV